MSFYLINKLGQQQFRIVSTTGYGLETPPIGKVSYLIILIFTEMKTKRIGLLWRKQVTQVSAHARPMVQLAGIFNDPPTKEDDFQPKCFFTGL